LVTGKTHLWRHSHGEHFHNETHPTP
jgi:hypothetical protein